MDNAKNYQKLMDTVIANIVEAKVTPSLLLHSCCAPCSSYVLEYLSQYFRITVLYYNPNIDPKEEYTKRCDEQRRLIGEMTFKNAVDFVEGRYDTDEFYSIAKGLEMEAEGNERCYKCCELRLSEAAAYASENGFDYFTTTLSISPHKNALALNLIGQELSFECSARFLYSDFKKKNGYKRSIELSREHELYRQNYCGCIFSRSEAE